MCVMIHNNSCNNNTATIKNYINTVLTSSTAPKQRNNIRNEEKYGIKYTLKAA